MSSNPVRDLEVAENYPMDSQAMTSNLLQLKQAMRATWMAGDFGQIARYMEREAEAFVTPRHGSPLMSCRRRSRSFVSADSTNPINELNE